MLHTLTASFDNFLHLMYSHPVCLVLFMSEFPLVMNLKETNAASMSLCHDIISKKYAIDDKNRIGVGRKQESRQM